MGFLLTWLSNAAQWFHDFFLWLPLHLYKLLLDGMVALLNYLPVPGFVSDASGWIGAIPSPVAYMLGSLRISDGLTIVLTAYTLRFLIRRIPFIG